MPSNSAYRGWSNWSAWTPCNDEGERHRSRTCTLAAPAPDECQGNEREVRVCNDIVVQTAGFGAGAIVLCVAVAVAFASSVSAYVMYVFMKRRLAPRDLKSIGSPCFDAFPNQYSSLPTKDTRPKVKRQSSFNSGGGLVPNGNGSGGLAMHSTTANGHAGSGMEAGSSSIGAAGLAAANGGRGASAKLLVNGTLTKSTNVTRDQTPKVLAKGHYDTVDTATIKRNSHALNNGRQQLRSVSDDDKF